MSTDASAQGLRDPERMISSRSMPRSASCRLHTVPAGTPGTVDRSMVGAGPAEGVGVLSDAMDTMPDFRVHATDLAFRCAPS